MVKLFEKIVKNIQKIGKKPQKEEKNVHTAKCGTVYEFHNTKVRNEAKANKSKKITVDVWKYLDENSEGNGSVSSTKKFGACKKMTMTLDASKNAVGWQTANGTTLTAKRVANTWGSYFSYSAIAPKENYNENENLLLTVPMISTSIMIRRDICMGKPFGLYVGNRDDKETREEKYMSISYKNMGMKKNLKRISTDLDTYGNSYWEKLTAKNKKEIVAVKRINPKRMRARKKVGGETGYDNYQVGEQIGWYYAVPNPRLGGFSTQTIVLEMNEVIHFSDNNFLNSPFGISIIQLVKEPAWNRRDFNLVLPLIAKKYIKAWIHWKLLTDKVRNKSLRDTKIAELRNELENTEPDSDIITTDEWEAKAIMPSVKMPEEIVGDCDWQICAAFSIAESVFKSKGSTDLKSTKQLDTFFEAMINRREMIAETLYYELHIPMIRRKFRITKDEALYTKTPKLIFEPITEADKIKLMNAIGVLYEKALVSAEEGRTELISMGVRVVSPELPEGHHFREPSKNNNESRPRATGDEKEDGIDDKDKTNGGA